LAAFFRTPGRVELREIERPTPGPGEVLVRITAAGICGSDVAGWREIEQDWHRRGHEYAGVVEAVGEGVADMKPGQLVAGYGSLPCGVCSRCQEGKARYCLQVRGLGGGAFAEYLCGATEYWYPLEGLSAEEGSLLEPMTVALEMVRDGDVAAGKKVLLLGGGPIGLMALAMCKAKGAEVFVSHRKSSRKRWELAEAMGADAMIDAGSEDVAARTRELAPEGADAVLITTKPAEGIGVAAAAAKRGAALSLIGMQWKPVTLELDIDRFHFANLRLVGSNHNPCSLHYDTAAELFRQGKVRADQLVSHRFPLAEIEAAFRLASEKPGEVAKVVIVGE
jgi:L-iditol 2-dehydrogenase